MRFLIKPLMPRPRPISSLHPGLARSILNALEVNNPSRKIIRTLRIMKKISLFRIFLLMHHQVGLNPLRHSSRRTKTVVLAKKNLDNKAKIRILLLLASTPPPSRRTKTRIRTRKIYPILNTTLVNRKVIMLTSVPKKSHKTSVGLDNLHVGD